MGLWKRVAAALKLFSDKHTAAVVVILGLDSAGKSTLLKQLCGEQTQNVAPTQGFNVKTLVRNGTKIGVWDIGGQKAIRPYWRNYFDKANAIVFVVDCADRLRLVEAAEELHHLLQEEQLSGAPLLVFANKQDLAGALTPGDLMEGLNVAAVRDRKWHVEGCSAINGQGLEHGMDWLMDQLGIPGSQSPRRGRNP